MHEVVETVGALAGSLQFFPVREYLTHSRPLEWGKVVLSAQLETIMERLLNTLEEAEAPRTRSRTAKARQSLKEVLGMIVLDLLHARSESRELWVAYPRGDADFLTKRYLPPQVTRTNVVTVVSFLTQHGLAAGRMGSFCSKTGGKGRRWGYRSRLQATQELEDIFEGIDVTVGKSVDQLPVELIRLKSSKDETGTKRLIDYVDTDQTRAWRKALQAWSEMMALHDVSLRHSRHCTLYRVFNDGDWGRGGRYYGGWWQQEPSWSRKEITIDGEATIELDYGALHPRICYQLAGKPLGADVDPYLIQGLEVSERPLVKKCMLQLLNVSTEGALSIRPEDASLLRLGRTYPQLTKMVEDAHRDIADWFRSGPKGVVLQAIDAAIAERVLAVFTRLGRAVLPVHDSFIVAARDTDLLKATMTTAYMEVMGDLVPKPLPPVIRQ